jgi:DNA-binding transcriptional LysR family regulator
MRVSAVAPKWKTAQILPDGEAAEDAALAQATQPCGRVRLAAPMSFGVLNIAPLLPEFLATYPEVSIDLHVSDAIVDLIGEGFDAAIRIAVLPDSSLIARRLCEMPRYLVGSPDYLSKHRRPRHPLHLAEHRCIGYSYAMTAETWRFTKGGKSATVRTAGPLRVNNGDAMMPALIAETFSECAPHVAHFAVTRPLPFEGRSQVPILSARQ